MFINGGCTANMNQGGAMCSVQLRTKLNRYKNLCINYKFRFRYNFKIFFTQSGSHADINVRSNDYMRLVYTGNIVYI